MNWDPQTTDLPPDEPPHLWIRPDLDGWKLEVEEAPYPNDWKPRKVSLTFKSSPSARSAKIAVDRARTYLGINKKEGRPGLTDNERESLKKIFSQFPLPKKRERKANIEKIYSRCQNLGVKIAASTIGREYRSWLVGQGQPTKKYSR